MSPSRRKMFPDQNVHYIKNYSIGYQGANFVKASEYNNRYGYNPAGNALLPQHRGAVRYKRRVGELRDVRVPGGFESKNSPLSYQPKPVVVSVSQDFTAGLPEPYHPRSLPPVPESSQPPEESAPIRSEPADVPKEETLPPPVNVIEDQRKQPEEVPERGPEDEQKREEEPPLAEIDRETQERRRKAALVSYREELDRQLLYNRRKKETAREAKQQELRRAKDWEQELAREDQERRAELRSFQELTRQIYEKQIGERHSRASRKNHSLSKIATLPAPAPRPQPSQQLLSRDETVPAAPTQADNQKLRVLDELARLEREKTRLQHEMAIRNSVAVAPDTTKAAIDSMAFSYDVDRDRFKQVVFSQITVLI